jgi:hypothetical protein
MTSGLQPTTVKEAGQIVAKASGLDWCRDRAEVVDKINQIRELLNIHPDMPHGLFSDNFRCVKVSKFPVECAATCSCKGKTYHGITIPDDMDGVLSIWPDTEPFRIYSGWWEGRVGVVTDSRGPQLGGVTMAETFPTHRAMTEPSQLKFAADSDEDEDKNVCVTIIDHNGEEREIEVPLSTSVTTTGNRAYGIVRVVLPPDLVGGVVLMQSDGYVLSEFSPYESVPGYRRIKLPENSPDQVLLRGNYKFRPVYYDTEVVEVGSRLILELASRVLLYGETGTDAAELKRADRDEKRLIALIHGAMDKKRGNQDQDPSPFVRDKKLIRSRRLNGYSARRTPRLR